MIISNPLEEMFKKDYCLGDVIEREQIILSQCHEYEHSLEIGSRRATICMFNKTDLIDNWQFKNIFFIVLDPSHNIFYSTFHRNSSFPFDYTIFETIILPCFKKEFRAEYLKFKLSI